MNIDKYYGGFGEIADGTIQLSAMYADKTIAFTMKQSDKFRPGSQAYLQFAILYTTSNMERKVRVLNYTIAITDQISQVYSGIDMDAVLGLEIRRNMIPTFKTCMSNTRNQLCQTCINVLAHYRKAVSTSSPPAQFVLPESMKVYPLLLLGLMKTPAYGLTECFKLDAKIANLIQLCQGSFTYVLMKVYPRMYSIAKIIDPSQQSGTLISSEDSPMTPAVFKPPNMPASTEKIVPTDAYIIVNSDYIYIYLPKDISETLLLEIFGKSSLTDIVPEEGLPRLETEGSARVNNVIDNLRKERGGAYQQVKVLLYSSAQANQILKELLIEDTRNPRAEFSYLNFLTHLHRMILNKVQSS